MSPVTRWGSLPLNPGKLCDCLITTIPWEWCFAVFQAQILEAVSFYFLSRGAFSGNLPLLCQQSDLHWGCPTLTKAKIITQKDGRQGRNWKAGEWGWLWGGGGGERRLASCWLRYRNQRAMTSHPLCTLSERLPHRILGYTRVSCYFKPLVFGAVFVQQSETEMGTYKSPSSSNNSVSGAFVHLWGPPLLTPSYQGSQLQKLEGMGACSCWTAIVWVFCIHPPRSPVQDCTCGTAPSPLPVHKKGGDHLPLPQG